MWVDGSKVAEKTARGFPEPAEVVAKVKERLAPG